MQKNPIRLKGGDETRRYAKIVAQAYADAPDFDPAAVPAFQALARSLPKLFRMVQSKVEVVFVDGQPYRDDAHLVREVKRTGKLLVPRDFNNHPVFTPEQNLQSRAVHDWFAHLAPSAEFSQRGELRAYNAQAKLTPRAALPALFTDIVGQAMFATVYGYFAPQKIAILDGFDYVEVGRGPAVERAIAEGVEGVPEADPTAAYWEEPTKNPGGKMLRNPADLKRIPLVSRDYDSDEVKYKLGPPNLGLALKGRPVGPFQLTAKVDVSEPDPPDQKFDTITHLPTGLAMYVGRLSFWERQDGRMTTHDAAKIRLREYRKHWATLSREEKAALTEGYEFGQYPYPEQIAALKAFNTGADLPRKNPIEGAPVSEYNGWPAGSRADRIWQADEHRFAAKQIRELSRPYAYEVRSESGQRGTFQTHAEALKWAESNLKKGEFFTVSKDSDHFHEHYVKE